MVLFKKGDGQTSPFLLQFATFLAGEGTGITITTVAVTVVSGDAVLGTGTRAPTITDYGTSVLFWVSGGTTRTQTILEFTYTTTAGSTFDMRVLIDVRDSLQ
jgi:hypothetical protein